MEGREMVGAQVPQLQTQVQAKTQAKVQRTSSRGPLPRHEEVLYPENFRYLYVLPNEKGRGRPRHYLVDKDNKSLKIKIAFGEEIKNSNEEEVKEMVAKFDNILTIRGVILTKFGDTLRIYFYHL